MGQIQVHGALTTFQQNHPFLLPVVLLQSAPGRLSTMWTAPRLGQVKATDRSRREDPLSDHLNYSHFYFPFFAFIVLKWALLRLI